MMLAAHILCKMNAGKVKLGPCLPSLPVERQFFIEKSLAAVLLQRVYLVCDYLHRAHMSELLKMQVDTNRAGHTSRAKY